MKYINSIKSLYTYIKNSFISIFSFVIIKFIPKKDIFEIIQSLENKKVLVLGTGPSLDRLNQDLINNYEVIFFLNNSISVLKSFNFNQKKKIFFNSDLFKFKQLKKKIYSLDNTWLYIFIPIHLQLFFSFILFYFKKDVFLLIPKYRIGFPFEKNVTKSIITYDLAQNQDTKKILDISNFKPFPYTVALNAFYFLISCKVSKIHYLGCDFTTGKSLIANDRAVSDFSNQKIHLWVNKLKKLSKNYFINFKDLK
tara:strand:+ start:1739 stop:2497 length:759 start_codon:yes stop_codon:yes gene_type:complete